MFQKRYHIWIFLQSLFGYFDINSIFYYIKEYTMEFKFKILQCKNYMYRKK